MRRLTIAALTVLAAVLALPAHAEDANKAINNRLTAAFKATDEAERVDAVKAAVGIKDPATIRLVAKGLRGRSLTVRMTAIEALGRTTHPAALKALHNLYFRDMPLRENETLLALLLKEIGRHADPSSLKVFADKPFTGLTQETGIARAYGLANIRDPGAVALLFKALQLAGGDPRENRGGSGPAGGNRFRNSSLEGKFYPDIRVGIAVLTGRDPGRDKGEAVEWWVNGIKKKIVIEAERPEIPEPLSLRWEEFWGEAYYEGKPAPVRKPLGSPYLIIEDPDKGTIKAAVSGLTEAAKSKDTGVRAAAIEQFGGVSAPAVTRLVAKAFRDKAMRVQLEAIDCLGWTKDPSALKQLHRLYRRNKKLRDNEAVFTALLRAIGRHRDKSSLDVLRDSPFKGLTIATGQARIFGIANIRTYESVESLIKGMSLGGGDPRGNRGGGGEERFMVDMRIALFVLTGMDNGAGKDAWFSWWRENKKKFKISPDRPKLPDADRATWELFWNEPY
jgi:hypothetical protein